MKAEEIKKALAIRHSKDLFVTECKTGSGWAGAPILDGWAMKKSWNDSLYTGYEIKVSRGDFLQDEKWMKYLPFCNHFYFICPWGIINKNEVPQGCGLMYISQNGNKTYVKVKAPYREIDDKNLTTIMKYVLMSRTKIVESNYNSAEVTKLQQVEQFINKKENSRFYGQCLSKKLSELYANKIHKVQIENAELLDENKKLQEVKAFCVTNKIDIKSLSIYDLNNRIERLLKHDPLRNKFENMQRLIYLLRQDAERMHDDIDYVLEATTCDETLKIAQENQE